jgi:hypothetical protein
MKFTLNEYNKSLAMQVMRDAITLSASLCILPIPLQRLLAEEGGGGAVNPTDRLRLDIWVC